MSINDFVEQIREEVTATLSSDLQIQVFDTEIVPDFNDSNITYDNLDANIKKCKRLESCVLYVDLRDSTKLSADKRPYTLSRIYSTFVRSMIAAARHFNGHVRNIIGDRVMVLYDKQDCFTNAINTAILMNSISQYIINPLVKDFKFKCGVGIDYGKMLIAKAGAIRHGDQKEFYRSLVWLGRPANVASKLTDIAFKTNYQYKAGICQGNYYPLIQEPWLWFDRTYDEFIDDLQVVGPAVLQHKNQYFRAFFKTTLGPYETSYRPILITEAVFEGFLRDNPNAYSIKMGWWTKVNASIPGYSGKIYGGDIVFTAPKSVK
jgi:class 3 adenylate cyclase